MRLYGWVFGAVFGIFAVSATFCQVFSGFLAGFGCCFGDFCSFNYFFLGFSPALWIKNTVIRNGNLYEPGPPAYTYVNLPLPCVHAGAFLRFMSIISYRILVAKRSDS